MAAAARKARSAPAASAKAKPRLGVAAADAAAVRSPAQDIQARLQGAYAEPQIRRMRPLYAVAFMAVTSIGLWAGIVALARLALA